MNKRILLPAIASLLILSMVLSTFTPVMAVTYVPARALPTLQVLTIPEDDEVRKTGVIILGLDPMPGWSTDPDKALDQYCLTHSGAEECIKKEAQFKILVTFNGQGVTFTADCQFIKKEKMHPLQKPQFTEEVLRSVVTDESANFECKLRTGKPGVGVLDVYYVGPQEKQFIADYIMVVSVTTTIGAYVVYGVEMQDICVLGWAVDDNTMRLTKPDGTQHFSWPDPLGPFVSCEDLALWERANQGLPLLYD